MVLFIIGLLIGAVIGIAAVDYFVVTPLRKSNRNLWATFDEAMAVIREMRALIDKLKR